MTNTTAGFSGAIPVGSGFLFTIDGEEIGLFAEVSGLELRIEVATYQEGGENGYVHQLPGRMSWPNITLKRGVTNSDTLFSWVNQSAGPGFEKNSNTLTRSTGAITVIGSDGTQLRAYNLQGVFPIRWTGPKFDSTGNNTLDEELELVHQGFTSETFPPPSP